MGEDCCSGEVWQYVTLDLGTIGNSRRMSKVLAVDLMGILGILTEGLKHSCSLGLFPVVCVESSKKLIITAGVCLTVMSPYEDFVDSCLWQLCARTTL